MRMIYSCFFGGVIGTASSYPGSEFTCRKAIRYPAVSVPVSTCVMANRYTAVSVPVPTHVVAIGYPEVCVPVSTMGLRIGYPKGCVPIPLCAVSPLTKCASRRVCETIGM